METHCHWCLVQWAEQAWGQSQSEHSYVQHYRWVVSDCTLLARVDCMCFTHKHTQRWHIPSDSPKGEFMHNAPSIMLLIK